MRILMIDDEASASPDEFVAGGHMGYYQRALTSRDDWSLDVAQSASAAQQKIREANAPYHVIILDLSMPSGATGRQPTGSPEYSGVGVGKWIDGDCPDTKVVVLTSVTDMEVIKQVSELRVVKAVFFKHTCTPFMLRDALENLVS
ncbi:MAG: hypothetical protein O3A00_10860 [Planctomycetota bacterium]|nr:hypothetical protein [Planctomycetota bacterium]